MTPITDHSQFLAPKRVSELNSTEQKTNLEKREYSTQLDYCLGEHRKATLKFQGGGMGELQRKGPSAPSTARERQRLQVREDGASSITRNMCQMPEKERKQHGHLVSEVSWHEREGQTPLTWIQYAFRSHSKAKEMVSAGGVVI